MGIRGRRGGGATQGSADLSGRSDEDWLGDALLVFDDLASVVELVANGSEDLAESARQRVDLLREIRRNLRPREADPPNLDYGAR